MVLADLDRGAVTELPEGGEYISVDSRVRVVIAADRDAGNGMGTRQVGGVHIHQELMDRGRTVWSVAPSHMSRSNRGYYSHSELIAAEIARDAVTVVALVRYHNKWGGGRRYATTVFTRAEAIRVRGWPKHTITARRAASRRIPLLLGDGD